MNLVNFAAQFRDLGLFEFIAFRTWFLFQHPKVIFEPYRRAVLEPYLVGTFTPDKRAEFFELIQRIHARQRSAP